MTKEEGLIEYIRDYIDSGCWKYEACYLNKEDLEVIVKALEASPCEDCISRKDAVNALRQSLYDYEGKTEKQFLDSNDLDVSEWFTHRIFVQNMNDADVKAINALPPIQQEPKTGHWLHDGGNWINGWKCSKCGYKLADKQTRCCPYCGAKMEDKE